MKVLKRSAYEERRAAIVAALTPLAEDAIRQAGAKGISTREFAKQHKDHDVILCARALKAAQDKNKFKTTWTPIPKNEAQAQECRYFASEPPKEIV